MKPRHFILLVMDSINLIKPKHQLLTKGINLVWKMDFHAYLYLLAEYMKRKFPSQKDIFSFEYKRLLSSPQIKTEIGKLQGAGFVGVLLAVFGAKDSPAFRAFPNYEYSFFLRQPGKEFAKDIAAENKELAKELRRGARILGKECEHFFEAAALFFVLDKKITSDAPSLLEVQEAMRNIYCSMFSSRQQIMYAAKVLKKLGLVEPGFTIRDERKEKQKGD